jgi:serine/threonine protein kinase
MIEEDDVMSEIRLLKELKDKSRHIIDYIDDFKYSIKRCIITEYCTNGDLSMKIDQYKAKNEKIPLGKIIFWNMEILEGLAFLHKLKIIHRDIKPQYKKRIKTIFK